MSGEALARRPLCAICDGTNQTTQLCPECRADPTNADWRETDELLVEDVDAEASARPRLGEQSPPRRIPTLLQHRILELMAMHTVRMRTRRRVRQPGGQRVWVWREESRPLSYREIAFLLGCSWSYCRKVYRAVAE